MEEVKYNQRKYRYKSTKWFRKLSDTKHVTITVEYYNKKIKSWSQVKNWETLDYFIKLRNEKYPRAI